MTHTHLSMTNNELHIEDLPLAKIAACYDTPCYVYSKKSLVEKWQQFASAFQSHPHQINYAVKANSNLAILNVFASLGSGFDIVSEGELERVLKAGASPSKIVFSGVGKSSRELERAINAKVGCIHIESEAEFLRLNEMAKATSHKIPIAFRVNPNVDAISHPYISTGLKENKFGISIPTAKILYKEAVKQPHFEPQGLAFHIGSQMTSLNPIIEALDLVLQLVDELAAEGIKIQTLDVGGGLGVRYKTETPPSIEEYGAAILAFLKNRDLKLHIEPGRALTADAGLLLTKVDYIKSFHPEQNRYFAIVDAAMNDFMRPTLYSAWHDIVAVKSHPKGAGQTGIYDIVGPVCESSDFLGKDRRLTLQERDLLAVLDTGAYGFSMSSNYNSRPRCAEVLIDGKNHYLIRERESLASLYNGEKIP